METRFTRFSCLSSFSFISTPCLKSCIFLVSGEDVVLIFSSQGQAISFSKILLFKKHVDGSEKNLIFFLSLFHLLGLSLEKTLCFLAFRVALKKAREYFSASALYSPTGSGVCLIGSDLGPSCNFGISPPASAMISPCISTSSSENCSEDSLVSICSSSSSLLDLHFYLSF